MVKIACSTVDDYIATQPQASRKILEKVRQAIRSAVPDAEETISYNIPTYKVAGAAVIYFAGWKQHFSLYPVSASLLAECSHEGGSYKLQKSTIRLPFTEPVPSRLIACIVKARLKAMAGGQKKRAARR